MRKLLDFPMRKITEGSAEIFIPVEEKISKKLPVFYNPAMKLNRDITVLLLQQFPPMSLCDPLAGTGIRSIRLAKEVKHKPITANDLSEKAAALIDKRLCVPIDAWDNGFDLVENKYEMTPYYIQNIFFAMDNF